jgi:NAD(P)-dependent dehydrogenase (short-subunit alcohol dehydrogenase family)
MRPTVSHSTSSDPEWEVPMKRTGDPSDIVEGAALLASEAAGYITGVVLDIDGGYLDRLIRAMTAYATQLQVIHALTSFTQ